MERPSLLPLLNGSQLELSLDGSIGQAEKDPPSADSLGFIIPLLLTILEVTFLSIIGWRHWKAAKKPKVVEDPEVIDNVSLCRDGKAPYDYGMIFRLGCPTPKFNCKTAFIDFELLGLDGERLGEMCRMDLSKLPDRICGEVKCRIQRLIELPPLLGIRAHHSDPRGNIYLYDYQLEDLKTGGTIEVRKFNTYLTNVPTVYKGKVLDEDALEEGYYPEVPTSSWAPLEVAVLAVFYIASTCVSVSILEYFNFAYPTSLCHGHAHLYRSFIDIAIVVPLMISFLIAITLLFKYLFKKQLHQEKYAIVPADAPNVLLNGNMIVFGFLLAFTLVGAGGSIALGIFFSFTKSAFVWSSTLIVCICIFGCWASGNKAVFLYQAMEPSSQAIVPADNPHGRSLLASPYYNPPGQVNTGHQKTVLFKNPKAEPKNEDSWFGTFLFGPKMVNPKRGKPVLVPRRKASALVRSVVKHPRGSGASLKTCRSAALVRCPTPLLARHRTSHGSLKRHCPTTLPSGHRASHRVSHDPTKVSRLVRPQGASHSAYPASHKLGRHTSHGSLKRHRPTTPPPVGHRVPHHLPPPKVSRLVRQQTVPPSRRTSHGSLKRHRTSPVRSMKKPTASPRPASIRRNSSKRSHKK